MTSGNVELTAVNQDGEAVGLAFDAAEPPSQQACWIRGQSFGAFAQPSSTPHRLIPMAVGVGLVSVGMAFDESDATSEARAVIMRPERTVFLDDVASGQFVIASSISRCGSILAAAAFSLRGFATMACCNFADSRTPPSIRQATTSSIRRMWHHGLRDLESATKRSMSIWTVRLMAMTLSSSSVESMIASRRRKIGITARSSW